MGGKKRHNGQQNVSQSKYALYEINPNPVEYDPSLAFKPNTQQPKNKTTKLDPEKVGIQKYKEENQISEPNSPFREKKKDLAPLNLINSLSKMNPDDEENLNEKLQERFEQVQKQFQIAQIKFEQLKSFSKDQLVKNYESKENLQTFILQIQKGLEMKHKAEGQEAISESDFIFFKQINNKKFEEIAQFINILDDWADEKIQEFFPQSLNTQENLEKSTSSENKNTQKNEQNQQSIELQNIAQDTTSQNIVFDKKLMNQESQEQEQDDEPGYLIKNEVQKDEDKSKIEEKMKLMSAQEQQILKAALEQKKKFEQEQQKIKEAEDVKKKLEHEQQKIKDAEDAKKKLENEQQKIKDAEDAKKKLENEQQKIKEIEEAKKELEQEQIKATLEAKQKFQEEQKQLQAAEELRKKQVEDQQKQKEASDLKRKLEEDYKKKIFEETQKKLEEDYKRKAEENLKKKQEEECKQIIQKKVEFLNSQDNKQIEKELKDDQPPSQTWQNFIIASALIIAAGSYLLYQRQMKRL